MWHTSRFTILAETDHSDVTALQKSTNKKTVDGIYLWLFDDWMWLDDWWFEDRPYVVLMNDSIDLQCNIQTFHNINFNHFVWLYLFYAIFSFNCFLISCHFLVVYSSKFTPPMLELSCHLLKAAGCVTHAACSHISVNYHYETNSWKLVM